MNDALDENATTSNLLLKNFFVSIHIRNLQPLSIEMYKVVNGGSAEIMNVIFRFRGENI